MVLPRNSKRDATSASGRAMSVERIVVAAAMPRLVSSPPRSTGSRSTSTTWKRVNPSPSIDRNAPRTVSQIG